MIVMAHHLGEDQLIQALLGAGGTLSVALVAASHPGPEPDRSGGKRRRRPGEPVASARPQAEVVPAGEAGVGSGAGQLVDGEPLRARRAEGRAWPGRDAEARLVTGPRRSSSGIVVSRSPIR